MSFSVCGGRAVAAAGLRSLAGVSDGAAVVREHAARTTSAANVAPDCSQRFTGYSSYSTIVSCDTTLMNGENDAVRPKRSVAVTV